MSRFSLHTLTLLVCTPARVIPVFFILAITLYGDNAQRPTSNVTAAHSERSPGQKRQVEGIPNFGQVDSILFRGGQPNDEGFAALAHMGVKIVVDARGNQADEQRKLEALGMQYVAIPWHCPWPRDEVFAQFLSLLQTNPGKKVFVHCSLGEDRTGMMVAAYRMAVEGWSTDEAMKEMRAYGFSSLHHVICPGLAGYEKDFPQRLKSSPAFQYLRSKEGETKP